MQSVFCARRVTSGCLSARRTMRRLYRHGLRTARHAVSAEYPTAIPPTSASPLPSCLSISNNPYLHHSATSATGSAPRSSHPPLPLSSLHSSLSPQHFKDLNPANFPPAHESRRRNAEQRQAALRADPLLEEIEPNRVFCKLCHKWVQLRQDSSFCAYPWVQHRGKCVARQ